MSIDRTQSWWWRGNVHDLPEALRDDPGAAVELWFRLYAVALLGRDLNACRRLVDDTLSLPPDAAALVAARFAPATRMLSEGTVRDAVAMLSFDSTDAADLIESVFPVGPDDVDHADADRARVFQLVGIWLEATGRTKQAAHAFFEAGKRFAWQGDSHRQTSLALLTRARALNPEHALACWHLADAWLIRSYVPEPPYVDVDAIARSLDLWNAGSAIELPDESSSWVYVIRAFINEQLGRLDGRRRVALWWEALTWLERAIALREGEAGQWAMLARLHRSLGNIGCAAHAIAEALKWDPADMAALEEHAAVLATAGDFEQAIVAIETRLAHEPQNTWAQGVKAYVLIRQKEYARGLALIDEVIAREPHDLWNLDVRAQCCRLLGDSEAARRTYEQIWSAYDRPSLTDDDRRICGYAALRLGKPDEAVALLDDLSLDPLAQEDTFRILGLCHFTSGNVRRGEELMLSAIARARAPMLDELLAIEFADIEAGPAPWLRVPGARAAFNRVKRAANALLADLRRAASPAPAAAAVEELSLILESGHESGDARVWIEVAARTGLARLHLHAERWRQAARSYHALESMEGRFPEASLGLQRTLDALRIAAGSLASQQDYLGAAERYEELLSLETELSRAAGLSEDHQQLGDVLWKAGRDADGLAHFRTALAETPADHAAERAAILARIALALLQRGDLAEARATYLSALRELSGAKIAEPGHELGRTSCSLLRNVRQFWTVDTQWQAFAADPTVERAEARDFAAARESLTGFLGDRFRLSEYGDVGQPNPIVTPLALEVGSALVPYIDPQSDAGKFIYEDIPAMRQRIEASIGVRMPGIRVRGGSAINEGYLILLNEIRVASGVVGPGSKFCVAAASDLPSGEGVVEAIDPVTGLTGHWYSSAHWDALERRGVAALSETAFILAHVDKVLRQNLDRLLGVQETQTILMELPDNDAHAEFASSILGSDTQRLALSRVLRSLVREGTPITDWPSIIDAIQNSGLADVDAAVHGVRMKLRRQLPGNQPPVTWIQVPEEWETHVGADRDGPAFNGSSLDAHAYLGTIRTWLQSRSGPVALVTRSPRSRSVVRRLIAYQFPDVPVLARDEVLHAERIVPAENAASLNAAFATRSANDA